MHVLRGVKDDLNSLITDNFKEDEIREARDQLIEMVHCDQRGGHTDTENRTAAKVYAQEVTDLVYQLDKDGKMPKIVVAAENLAKVTLVKGALKPSDTAPISARMEDLESIVKKLAESFETFRKDSTSTRPSFATVAGVGTGRAGPPGQTGASVGQMMGRVQGAPQGNGGRHGHGKDVCHSVP